MTRVQQRMTALLAAFVLALGCALVAAMPQQAYAATDLQTAVGSTAAKATNVPLVGKSLSTTYYATFNRTNDNHFYKFRTSNRNSTYTIRLKALTTDGTIYFTVYDQSMHRFYTSQISTAKKRTITLEKLTRNQTYYVEIWRFAVDSPQYYLGDENVQYAEYSLKVKENVTPPAPVTGLKVTSPSSYKVRIKFNGSRYADGYQVQWDRTWYKTKKNKTGTWNQGNKLSKKWTTKYHGKTHKYRFKVRPYRTVNGKRHYGEWTTSKKIRVK